MTTICVFSDCPLEIIHKRLDEIADRFPCWATSYDGEITVKCRVEDAAEIERMLADLV